LSECIQEEQVYGDKFRMYAKEVAPYLKEEFSDAKLNTKLHLFSHAGDILIEKEKYDKVMLCTQIACPYVKSNIL
jgi:hypothetical protein